ncbi:PH domain-containing protein [Clostridium sp. 'deep sea']|uniref:PH domain-containing protein n=1 Tax=Clostridium sp. 'deep sea' TaxID=2779445 RepID=UPI0018965661|nr:PH domain-containing protein [Clostridium sp. 'deep sea']QOR33853.1 PH domain-containing protein [Clostridium sp. 'deep sea']
MLFNRTQDNNQYENIQNFSKYLTQDEQIEKTYKTVLNKLCFTNKRIIYYDNNLITKKRVSIPYKSIVAYTIEEFGVLNAELDLFTCGGIFEIEFSKGTNMSEVDKMIAKHIGLL